MTFRMRLIFTFCVLVSLAASAVAQTAADSAVAQGLARLSEYVGLKPGDLTFRSDYTEPDSLRLQLVADLMEKPMSMVDYAGSLRGGHVRGQPEILAGILFSDLALQHQTKRRAGFQAKADEMETQYNLAYTSLAVNQLMNRAAVYLDVIFPRSTQMALAPLTDKQKRFLTNELKDVVTMSVDDENRPPDELDSLEKIDEDNVAAFVEFAGKIDKDPILSAGIDCLRVLIQEIANLRAELAAKGPDGVLQMVGYLPANLDKQSYLGYQPGWKMGGPGNDYYKGDYRFILDVGGNDVYDLSYDPADPHGVIIIDLSGDDYYRGQTDFTLGSGCLSTGLLLDFDGNDRYDGKSFGVGSGWFGLGLIYDAAGDDRYDGDTHVQGAGTYGLGLIIDEGGRDVYNAAVYAQGFGFVQGAGVIEELDGSDTYVAGGKYKDILRYEDHYLSMSQGFGFGFRPWMSGGIGAIIDSKGNDNYIADIFAQASSYWWSLGIIYDSSGLDNYYCYQYGQGSATHMTVAALIDDHGSDTYFGKGVMQGCGHDYSCGLLLDREGNDTYTGFDKVQAAGSANGIGLLIDVLGNDRYFATNPTLSQGSGDPRRGFGSLGLFLDLGGKDQYDGRGKDNSFWKADRFWGGGMDIELNPPDSSEAAHE